MYIGVVLLHLSHGLLQPFHIFIVLCHGVRRGVDAVGAGGNVNNPRIRGPRPGSGLFDSSGTLEATLDQLVLGIRLLERVEVFEVLEGFVPVVLFFICLALVIHHVLLREIFARIYFHNESQNIVRVKYQAADGLSKLLVLVQIASIRDDVS